jgi:hypothetical protein
MDRAAIGGTDGKGTAIRKGEGKSRKRFRREEVTEGAEARSTEEDVRCAGVGDEGGERSRRRGEPVDVGDGRRGWRCSLEGGELLVHVHRKSRREDARMLVGAAAPRNGKLVLADPTPKPVEAHFDALRLLRSDGFLSEADGAFVVAPDDGRRLGVPEGRQDRTLVTSDLGIGEEGGMPACSASDTAAHTTGMRVEWQTTGPLMKARSVVPRKWKPPAALPERGQLR